MYLLFVVETVVLFDSWRYRFIDTKHSKDRFVLFAVPLHHYAIYPVRHQSFRRIIVYGECNVSQCHTGGSPSILRASLTDRNPALMRSLTIDSLLSGTP